MALNVNRWLQYAKARIDSAVGSGHESLDRLEAEQEAERADKPWLASDSTAPTFDEARARIAWEADQQAKAAARQQDDQTSDEAPTKKSASDKTGGSSDTSRRRDLDVDPGDAPEADGPAGTSSGAGPAPENADPTPGADDHTTTSADRSTDSGPAPRSPQQIAEDAERETARLELEERQRKSAERLDEIRRELGIDDPPTH